MKYFITSLCLLVSMSTLAQPISQTEAIELANEFQSHASEEVGPVISASCEELDGITYQCVFEYELPEDYCWYGSFKSSVTYGTDNHAALEIIESSTVWQN